MLNLVRMHAPIAEEMKRVFSEVLESGRYIGGTAVEGFEKELAAHIGAEHAIGVSSGTDALLVTLMALGVGAGDEIITTPYTFFATAGSIARLGAKPVFIDIDPITFNIDTTAIEAAVTERTVGIVPVHLFGQCAEMIPALDVARTCGLWVVEDAAQAIGAKFHQRSAGTMGKAGTFSFFPAKNLGALGDAGAVVTDDPGLAEQVRSLRQHGAKQKYRHDCIGGNFRLDALQASLLSVKLPFLEEWEAGRRRVAARYHELLSDLEELTLPVEPDERRHVFNQYVVRSPKRDAIKRSLESAGIGCAVYYPEPLHVQECFAHLGYCRGDFPEAERAAKESLALPIDPLLGDAEIARVATAIGEGLK